MMPFLNFLRYISFFISSFSRRLFSISVKVKPFWQFHPPSFYCSHSLNIKLCTLNSYFLLPFEQLWVIINHAIQILVSFFRILFNALNQFFILESCINKFVIIILIFHLLDLFRAGIENFTKFFKFLVILLLNGCWIFLHDLLCFVTLILDFVIKLWNLLIFLCCSFYLLL